MRPIDFTLFDGDSSPNTPVREIFEALQKPLWARTEEGDLIVQAYYYDDVSKRMILALTMKEF